MITADRSGRSFAAILAIALGLGVPSPGLADTGAASVECSVLYQTPDGLFVDAGSDRGLEAGNRGTVTRGGEQIAAVEVVETSSKWALLRIVSSRGPTKPALGDRVSITIDAGRSHEKPKETDEASTSLKNPLGARESFVPLLGSPTGPQRVRADPSNIFHGDISIHQLFQFDPKTNEDFSITRLGSSGFLERMAGTPWALEWSTDLSYRDGKGLEDTLNYQEFRLHVYRVALYRKFKDGSSVRMGRFLPRVLPGVGYLDGAQAEKAINEHLSLGTMIGLRAERTRLDFSLREPTAVPYLTLQAGQRENLYYYGTAGVLGSLYEGKPDRLAVLVDQHVEIGRWLSVGSTSAVDFDVAMETRSGTRLTRQDLFGSYFAAPFLTLRAGLDHYERPDTEAERDTLEFENDRFFDRGYWRYWLGADHALPWNLLVSEEVAFTESPQDDYEPRWRASLTRKGLPALSNASLTLSVYNFSGFETEGYGGSISTDIPLLDHRLYLHAATTLRYLETDVDSDDFQVVDVAGHVNWWISRSWSIDGGVSYSFGDDVERFLIDVGVRFHW